MYRPRVLETRLLGSVSRNKVRFLFGARQTGKSSLLRHALPRERTRVYDLADASLRLRFEADPAALSREIRALPKAIENVVLDEIQKVPALLDEIQTLHDAAPRARQYFLTGSSARRLRARATNLLPGRSHTMHIHPVCAWEFAQAAALAIGAPRGWAPPPGGFPRPRLERLLQLGSLPGILAEPRATAAATLETYAQVYLEEEIRREALVREIGPFVVFLRLAATEAGGQINLRKLSQESGVPASTLSTYYQVLVDTFIGTFVEAYAHRSRKRLLTTPRFLFLDVGVRNGAAGRSLDARISGDDGGRLLEQWVGQELIARASYLGRPHRVSFWRTTTGAEVDYVWESAREDIPIEVKWTERPRPEDARHLETFLDEHPKRSRRGLVVCRCAAPQQLTDRVTAIGWDRL